MRTKKSWFGAAARVWVTAGVHAQGACESIVIMPHDIVWKAPPVSPGPETAVIYGDPSKPGVYVMPHFHPDE